MRDSELRLAVLVTLEDAAAAASADGATMRTGMRNATTAAARRFTEGVMESLQMRPARLNALAAGVTETAGGALLAAGLATPLAAAGLTGVMTTAIRKVDLPNGPWAANGGWEYNAVLIAGVTALAG